MSDVVPGSVLASLAARYAWWMSINASSIVDSVDDDPALVRAMPVVLRIEKTEPPARTSVLEAAAAAALAVCLDPRSAPGKEWHEEIARWIAGRIRKVSRRARGVHWQAVQDLPGRTVSCGGAEARALLPGLVVDTPKEVSRLQISGSELLVDSSGSPPPGTPVLWLNPDVAMTTGKAAAQVGHGSMVLAAMLYAEGAHDLLDAWAVDDFRCAVRTPSQAEWAAMHPGTAPKLAWREHRVAAVRDAGYTEVAPGTVTVLAQWPVA